jgi:hypothetical protein
MAQQHPKMHNRVAANVIASAHTHSVTVNTVDDADLS